MAENVVLKLLLKGAEKAEADVKELNKNLSDTTKELDDAKNNFSLFGVSVGDVKGKFKELKGIAAGVLKKIAIQAKLAGGGLRMMFGGKMAGGAKVLFNVIKTGIAATGIGALVIAFASLATYFTQTKKGAELLEQAFAGVGAAISVITDRISQIGGAIAKVFSGDFKGAAEDVKGALSGITDEIKEEATAAVTLKKAFNGLADAQRDLRVKTAESKAEIEALKIIAEDVTKSDKERTEAAQKAFDTEQTLMAERIAIAEEALRIKQEENALGESMAEDLDAEADLQIELAAIKEESTAKQIGLQNFLNGLKQATRDKEKAAAAERQAEIDAEVKAEEEAAAKKEALALSEGEKLLAIQQENALLLIEDANERALAQIEIDRQNALNSVADTEHTEAMKAEINKKYNKKKQEQNKATSDAERSLNTGDLAAVGSMLGGVADLQNKGTAGWKATKIAEARINTFIGAQGAFNSMINIPVVGQVLAPIAAGIAILAGQKQVDAINATEIPKMARGGVVGGYGNGTSDSVNAKLSRGEVVINAKSAKMFRGALSNMNVAGGGVGFARGGATTPSTGAGISGLSTEPLKAFVLTDEMSDSQAKLAKIRRRSKL